MHDPHIAPRVPEPGVPVAGVDPIDSPETARRLIHEVLAVPERPETVAILLDDHRRGIAVLSVDATVADDAVLDVADRLAELARHLTAIAGIVLVTVRPDRSTVLDDLDRWIEIDGRFDEVGVELLEWFVIGRDVSCPRTLLGQPARWGRRRVRRRDP